MSALSRVAEPACRNKSWKGRVTFSRSVLCLSGFLAGRERDGKPSRPLFASALRANVYHCSRVSPMRRRTSDDTLEITTSASMYLHLKCHSPGAVRDIDDLCNPLCVDDLKHLSASIMPEIIDQANFNDVGETSSAIIIGHPLHLSSSRTVMIAFSKINGYNSIPSQAERARALSPLHREPGSLDDGRGGDGVGRVSQLIHAVVGVSRC